MCIQNRIGGKGRERDGGDYNVATTSLVVTQYYIRQEVSLIDAEIM